MTFDELKKPIKAYFKTLLSILVIFRARGERVFLFEAIDTAFSKKQTKNIKAFFTSSYYLYLYIGYLKQTGASTPSEFASAIILNDISIDLKSSIVLLLPVFFSHILALILKIATFCKNEHALNAFLYSNGLLSLGLSLLIIFFNTEQHRFVFLTIRLFTIALTFLLSSILIGLTLEISSYKSITNLQVAHYQMMMFITIFCLDIGTLFFCFDSLLINLLFPHLRS